MKLVAYGIRVFCLWLVCLFFSGCTSPNDVFFSDNPTSPVAVAGTNSAAARASTVADADVARFHVGDPVIVSFSGLPVDIPIHQEPIKEDGTITLPDIGSIQAAGKTAGELQNDIHDLYVPKYYTHLTVTVDIGERVYYVKGEVKNPGAQLYRGEVTVTKAITAASDFTDFASHKVWLIRASGQRIKVNCDRVLTGKDPDPQVYPNDQIQVPRRIW